MMSDGNKIIDFLENYRIEESFAALFTNATNVITKLELNEIRVSRERKVPRRKDSGSQAYIVHPSVEDHFRNEYFKIIDIALQQLYRFHQPGIIKNMKMEDCLLKSNEALDELLSDYPEATISRLRVQLGLFKCSISLVPLVRQLQCCAACPRSVERSLTKWKCWFHFFLFQQAVTLQSAVSVRSDALRHDCAARCLKLGLTMCVCSTSIRTFLTH